MEPTLGLLTSKNRDGFRIHDGISGDQRHIVPSHAASSGR